MTELTKTDQLMTRMTTVKGDKDIATELRKQFFDVLTPVCELIGEAKKNGFEVGFAFGENAFGQTQIQQINLMKKY